MSTFKAKDFNTLIQNFGRRVFYLEEIIQTKIKRKESVWVLYRANVRKRKVGANVDGTLNARPKAWLLFWKTGN